MPSLRRRLLGVPAIALHRLALALVRRQPAPPPRAGDGAVRIVLANAHAMGGTVQLRSAVGRGTVVTVTIPQADPTASAASADAAVHW